MSQLQELQEALRGLDESELQAVSDLIADLTASEEDEDEDDDEVEIDEDDDDDEDEDDDEIDDEDDGEVIG